MSDPPFERLFSMGALEALRILRIYSRQHADLSLRDLTSLVLSVDVGARGQDFEAGAALADIVLPSVEVEDGARFYRSCIESIIFAKRPVWLRVMRYGRAVFAGKLTRDEAQCFHAAGLMVEPVTDDVLSWWRRLQAHARQVSEIEAQERAQQAEQLSLAYERERLAQLNIEHSPKWMGFEDNTAGYDVLSFDRGVVEPTNRLIEVKSTIASPLRFFLTRNEWDQAVKFGERYHFHIWDMSIDPPKLYERSRAQVEPNIPSDNGKGRWQNVLVRVGADE